MLVPQVGLWCFPHFDLSAIQYLAWKDVCSQFPRRSFTKEAWLLMFMCWNLDFRCGSMWGRFFKVMPETRTSHKCEYYPPNYCCSSLRPWWVLTGLCWYKIQCPQCNFFFLYLGISFQVLYHTVTQQIASSAEDEQVGLLVAGLNLPKLSAKSTRLTQGQLFRYKNRKWTDTCRRRKCSFRSIF